MCKGALRVALRLFRAASIQTKPSVRSSALGEVDWDEAISFVADKLGKIKAEHGPNSIAALGSERLTNEEAYVFNRLIRSVINTPNIDHSGDWPTELWSMGFNPPWDMPPARIR